MIYFKHLLSWGLSLCSLTFLMAQTPDFTADETVLPYNHHFGYGANVGAYPPWTDVNLANLAAGNDSLGLDGIGITTFRPELPELFVEYWGYGIRKDEFQHYKNLGMEDHVLFIGQPSPQHRDSTFYCSDHMSKLFKNMYAPIWDNGENGTPVNDTNYFARYVYLLALNYGEHVKFWEVWNEPDLDVGGNAPLPPGAPGNWWDNNPPPCEVHIFAPIEHYVRLLRITYEVVKSIYPEDYVAVGGLGNPSFLDAVLRNTDNPVDGSVTAEYPHKGGAYFDCMSFHSYPHLDGSMRGWDNNTMDFVFFRHSDAALDGLIDRRDAMEKVLEKYGYDGLSKPEKVWILTESNIPRKSFTRGFIGTAMAQRNFLVKSLITIQKYHVKQFHVYSLADVEPEDSASYEFEVMGLVKNLTGTMPHAFELTEAGIAYGSCAKILKGYHFDHDLYNQLKLTDDDSVRGGAFRNDDDEVMFVLWAKTKFDSTEYATANYSFPDNLEIKSLDRLSWHYMVTGATQMVDSKNISLNGDPIFLKPFFNSSAVKTNANQSSKISIFPNPTDESFNVSFYLDQPEQINADIFDMNGKLIQQCFSNNNFMAGENIFKCKVDDLPRGVYLLKMTGTKFFSTQKLILR